MQEMQFWSPWTPRCRIQPGAVTQTTGTSRVILEKAKVARARARAAAIAAVARDLPEKASDLGRIALGIALDEWQARLIDSPIKRKAILGARQCGKSMAVAIQITHRMLKRPDTSVIVMAASARQSGLLVDKCRWILRKLGVEFQRDGLNPQSVLLDNGSRVVGLPKSPATIRGFTADLLIIDEAAYVPDVAYAAARPMLAATDGELVVMSTANEPRGFFWDLTCGNATGGRKGWLRFVIRAADVPHRLRPGFLEGERRELGPVAYAREYECEFVDTGSGIFARKTVESALSDEVEPLFPGGIRGRGSKKEGDL